LDNSILCFKFASTKKTTMTHNIRVIYKNENLINENFADKIQFKLFLKAIHGSLQLKNTLQFFNGNDFLVNIPYKILSKCVILTKVEEYTITDHLINKSKMESLVD
jgi:hypothetical protein